MERNQYESEIERILRDIPELERHLATTDLEPERISLERSLKMRRKRFERMIPYRFRMQLRRICQCAGVDCDFM